MPPKRSGVIVDDTVPGSPAEAAGLQRGDIITKVGETLVIKAQDYLDSFKAMSVGKPVKFRIIRPIVAKRIINWKSSVVTVTPITVKELDRLKKHNCPLRIVSATLHRNVIGEPEVTLTVKNSTDNDAVAIEVNIECWNRFDEKVLGWGKQTNVFTGISQKRIEKGKEEVLAWQLSARDTTAKIRVTFARVKFADGTLWKDEKSEEGVGVKAKLAD